MKKIIPVGLLAGLLMLVAGTAWGYVARMIRPEVGDEYMNDQIFRPWSDPAMSLFFLHPFVSGIILAWIWTKTMELIGHRGVAFGFIYWIVTLPGMLITYASFKVTLLIVLTWTLSGLVQSLTAGLVFEWLLPTDGKVKRASRH